MRVDQIKSIKDTDIVIIVGIWIDHHPPLIKSTDSFARELFALSIKAKRRNIEISERPHLETCLETLIMFQNSADIIFHNGRCRVEGSIRIDFLPKFWGLQSVSW